MSRLGIRIGPAALALALLISGVGAPAAARAHDRDIATFVLRPVSAEVDGARARGWILDVHVARAALDAVTKGDAAIDPDGWRRRAVAYVGAHVRLIHEGRSLALRGGGIRVGGHQTDLRFLLPGIPPGGGPLTVHIDAFAEDGHQSNVLKLPTSTPRTVVLTAENGYAAEVKLTRGRPQSD